MADYNDYYDMSKDANFADREASVQKYFQALERMEQTVLKAKSMPFSGNCILDRDELKVLIGILRDSLPVELKQAYWLLDQSHQLLETARREADKIVGDAQKREAHLIDTHEITQQARNYAQEMIDEAHDEAQQIRAEALEYTGRKLKMLDDQLQSLLVTVRQHQKELQD